MHSHFFPERVFRAIWKFFSGRNWRVRYQGETDALARALEGFGVERYVVYNYAHRPGMAAELNRWTDAFAQRHPASIPFATVLPGDEGNARRLLEL